jgi:hypothetical protein
VVFIALSLLGAAPAATVDGEPSGVAAQETADLRAELERLRTRLEWLRDRITVTELARQARSFYRELKALNPEIVEDSLGKGRYSIRVPKGHASFLLASVLGAIRVSR